MGDCCNMYGRRPDWQLYDRIFQKFRWKSFLFKSRVRTVRHWRPNGRTSTASNFHIRLRASGPRGMNVWTTIHQHAISISAMRASGPWEVDVRTVEVESAISILVVRTSGPRLTNVRMVILNCDSCLIYERVWTGNHIVWTVYQSSYILNLERIWSWSITDGCPDGMLKGPDGCKLEQKLLDTV
jgi:hypothetical protein